MSPLLWCAYFALILISTVIQSTLGFGFAIFAMIFLPSLFELYPQAVAVSSLLTLFTTSSMAVRLRAYTKWHILIPCVIGYFISSPIAIRLSVTLEKGLLMRLLGAALILLSFYFIFGGNRIRIRPTKCNGTIAGMISGVTSGLFGIGGPPIVVYLLSSFDDKNEYMATSQMAFAITGLYATIVRTANGIFTAALLGRIAVGGIAVAIGTVLGYRLLERIPIGLMRKLIYALMIFAGLKMLLNF